MTQQGTQGKVNENLNKYQNQCVGECVSEKQY